MHAQKTTNRALVNVDIASTNVLTTAEQHFPLSFWFSQKNIKPTFDYSAVDMSGYFDEAAKLLSEHYYLVKDLLGKVNWSYQKKHSGINVDLSKMAQKDGQTLNNLCRQLYSHTLFAEYFYQKQDKIIRLKLQKASNIENFFSGGWLEWFALSAFLHAVQKNNKNNTFSCARNITLKFSNEDVHELDVMWLQQNKSPVIVECKSGEFRQDIEKYIRLKKRLDIPSANFIILASELEDLQTTAMTSMYGLTFLNINSFSQYITTLM